MREFKFGTLSTEEIKIGEKVYTIKVDETLVRGFESAIQSFVDEVEKCAPDKTDDVISVAEKGAKRIIDTVLGNGAFDSIFDGNYDIVRELELVYYLRDTIQDINSKMFVPKQSVQISPGKKAQVENLMTEITKDKVNVGINRRTAPLG